MPACLSACLLCPLSLSTHCCDFSSVQQAKRDEDLLKLPISELFYKARRWAGIDFNVKIFTWFLSNVMDAWKHEWVELLECRARKKQKWEWTTDENWMFQHQDARALHSVVRAFKPKRVVEIGSGYSTRIGAGAVELNKKDGHEGKYLIIEPFPSRVPDPLPGLCRPGCIIKDFMEKVPLKYFTSLESGDMLFIDSSHFVGKHHDHITGLNMVWRDVAIEFTELIPRLRPGVIVHVHDIPYPLPVWYEEKYYIEQFMVQALLQDNPYLEPLWFGGAAAAPFHEADGMSLLEWEGLQLELERVFDMQDEKAPAAFNGRKLTDKGFSFQGGGSIYFRRTAKEYPGRDECPSGGKIEDCEMTLEQVFDRHRSWGLMGSTEGNSELKKALTSVKLRSEATQDTLLCAAIKTYDIVRIIEICQGAGGPSKGGPVPTGCLTSPAGKGAAEFITCGKLQEKTDIKHAQLSSTALQDFHAYGGDGGMVLFKFSRATKEAKHPNDAAIAFISEVLPRLRKGTLVAIFGVPFPAHKNFDSDSKYGDAAQMLVQAAVMDNPKYSVELVRDTEMLLRRV